MVLQGILARPTMDSQTIWHGRQCIKPQKDKEGTRTMKRVQKHKPRTGLDGAYIQRCVPIRCFGMAIISFLFSLPFGPLALRPLS